ncbi:MAG: phage integrase N-terminal SAM-like domain-containing protein [Anaerolineaceae bacterium]
MKKILEPKDISFMKLLYAIEGFLICKTGNRKGDLSPKTLYLYRHLLIKLCESLENPDIEIITEIDLARFMSDLADPKRNLSTSAQDNYFKAIRSFWKWAVENFKVDPIHLKLRQPAFIITRSLR